MNDLTINRNSSLRKFRAVQDEGNKTQKIVSDCAKEVERTVGRTKSVKKSKNQI